MHICESKINHGLLLLFCKIDFFPFCRQIEEDYTTYAADIVRKSSWSEIEHEGKIMCPICHTTELKLNSDGTRTNQNVCKDCEEITCDECGDYTMSVTTKVSYEFLSLR